MNAHTSMLHVISMCIGGACYCHALASPHISSSGRAMMRSHQRVTKPLGCSLNFCVSLLDGVTGSGVPSGPAVIFVFLGVAGDFQGLLGAQVENNSWQVGPRKVWAECDDTHTMWHHH